ncbi:MULTISPECIES: chemotaxis protein CheA [unclassified Paenibacillus]|uniref:chemotaxis protein CheA n=1 Tax=unclassified Paenibacillus TaxID=185978 RepID=UPI001AEB3B73|nr:MULTISPECIES: chemotaxis protein CheA [unclassified Paenibacillus]MBP1155987.1 two-component system chemotaxis sensor kinase CheA [Paenibacillus sp. PvP091]MBP1168627.1 two-component system chemotaxis sensor kinase CheA [Paenibacillus sp. PvR098]MBP2439655.1 two-component system chemotaxis sensor kinase CheA [Paenibacillus sp. PvP052]
MEMNQYLSMFIDESRDHLQAMNEHLLSLENSPEDVSIVQHIFRSAHTLKGMSATMGFEDLASLTHEMENVLDLVRNHKLNMDSFIFDCIFKSLDALETMVEDIIQGGTGKADVTEIVAALKSIVSGDYAKNGSAAGTSGSSAANEVETGKSKELDEFQFSILQQTIEAGIPVFRIEVTVRQDCVLKAARAYMVFNVLEQNGEVIQSNPSVEDIEQERFEQSFVVYYISQMDQEQLSSQIASVSEIDKVDMALLDQAKLDDLIKAPAPVQAHVNPVASVPSAAQSEAPKAEAKKSVNSGGTPVGGRTIRVDIERLDTLMNLFSELLIDRVRLEQLASEVRRSDLTETVEHMARVSSDLQSIVLKLRMVPVDSVFNRFPRMIRDVAKTLDKKVDLIITGADTELDRTVVDEIGDPLVHLLRNAVDHGIEPTAERLQLGKIETGTIHLRAYHSGNHVFIEIEEDGRGINREKVLNKAIQNGVVTAEQAERLADEDVYQLLFASGFSTADKISDISGRGVGLDVVKTKIESLGGHVNVSATWGKGTKFSVQLPLTLSIISAMLIRLGEEKYAIPLSSIVETMAVKSEEIRVVHGIAMINYRSTVIPLIRLAHLFDVPGITEETDAEMQIVVIRKGDKMAALVVNEFIGQQEIVLKSLGKYLTNLFAVSGGTILGDGQVALIIDTNALIK